jgi:hypothetical protein
MGVISKWTFSKTKRDYDKFSPILHFMNEGVLSEAPFKTNSAYYEENLIFTFGSHWFDFLLQTAHR